jgi:hypothetical protein
MPPELPQARADIEKLVRMFADLLSNGIKTGCTASSTADWLTRHDIASPPQQGTLTVSCSNLVPYNVTSSPILKLTGGAEGVNLIVQY